MNIGELFDKDFFDSGEDKPGGYREYALSSMYPSFEALAIHLSNLISPRRVLDVGCAKGFLVLAFRNLGIESYGVDVSAYALEQAPAQIQQHLSKVDLNTEALPFSNASFELVTASFVLPYVYDLEHALGEIRRVMDNGAILFVKVSYPKYGSKRPTLILEKMQKKTEWRDEDAWIKELQSHGFEFMRKMTNDNYTMLISEWLHRALKTGRGFKYEVGRCIFRIPKFGLWITARHTRSRIGLLFFRVQGASAKSL